VQMLYRLPALIAVYSSLYSTSVSNLYPSLRYPFSLGYSFALHFFVKFPELTVCPNIIDLFDFLDICCLQWITKVGLGSAAACDLIIAVGLYVEMVISVF